jgi:hypothetical protein
MINNNNSPPPLFITDLWVKGIIKTNVTVRIKKKIKPEKN